MRVRSRDLESGYNFVLTNSFSDSLFDERDIKRGVDHYDVVKHEMKFVDDLSSCHKEFSEDAKAAWLEYYHEIKDSILRFQADEYIGSWPVYDAAATEDLDTAEVNEGETGAAKDW